MWVKYVGKYPVQYTCASDIDPMLNDPTLTPTPLTWLSPKCGSVLSQSHSDKMLKKNLQILPECTICRLYFKKTYGGDALDPLVTGGLWHMRFRHHWFTTPTAHFSKITLLYFFLGKALAKHKYRRS